MASEPSEEDIQLRRKAQSVSMAMAPSEEEIRLRAYHRFLERGAGHGYDFDDWLEAERELLGKRN
jgi:hypothetical protein